MPSDIPRGPRQILAAAKWSWAGLRACFRYEASFRLEFYLFILLVPLAFWLAESLWQLWMLIGSMVLVLVVEVLNSAIEAVVDLVVGEQRHALAGRAKDMGSAAVFLSQLLVVFTWGLVIYQNYWAAA